LASVLEVAQRFTAQFDWSDVGAAVAELERVNAFVDSSMADRAGLRLLLPGEPAALKA
jgi:hypothetical protein